MMLILIADDDDFFIKVTTDILRSEGHEIIVVKDGSRVVEEAIAKMPDLIILDVILPGLLGTEVSRKLRSYSLTASIPVLLVSTGVAELEEANEHSDFLADDFIHKPFRPDLLLDRVARLGRMRNKLSKRGQGMPPKPAPGSERRQQPRVPIDVEVTARTAECLLHHPMINISTGGIYVEHDCFMRRGTTVQMLFAIPDGVGLVTAEGEACWCLELEQGERWGTGIRFTKIPEESLAKIKRYTTVMLGLVKPESMQNGESDDQESGSD
jgi:uncharacterized protein (TIGR02266 family)